MGAEEQEDEPEEAQDKQEEDSASAPENSDDDIILEADRAEASAETSLELACSPIPPEGIVGNKASKLVHIAGNEWGTTACGSILTMDRMIEFKAWPCKPRTLCKRASCFAVGPRR